MGISSSAPWLNFYGDTPANIEYPRKTIYQMIESAASRYPKLNAYDFMGKTTTYETFLKRIELTAKSLLALGIQKGDRVTICMPNSPQAVDTF